MIPTDASTFKLVETLTYVTYLNLKNIQSRYHQLKFLSHYFSHIFKFWLSKKAKNLIQQASSVLTTRQNRQTIKEHHDNSIHQNSRPIWTRNYAFPTANVCHIKTCHQNEYPEIYSPSNLIYRPETINLHVFIHNQTSRSVGYHYDIASQKHWNPHSHGCHTCFKHCSFFPDRQTSNSASCQSCRWFLEKQILIPTQSWVLQTPFILPTQHTSYFTFCQSSFWFWTKL